MSGDGEGERGTGSKGLPWLGRASSICTEAIGAGSDIEDELPFSAVAMDIVAWELPNNSALVT
jgi:hypothetical protein